MERRTPLSRGESRLERRTPLARGEAELARRTELKRGRRLRRKRRSAEEFARIYYSPEFIFFCHAMLLCCVCGAPDPEWAHMESGGMGRKADAVHGAPLCAGCHRLGPGSYHAGADTFKRRHKRIDFALTGRRAIEAFEDPEVQAWIELMKADGTYERWLRRAA